MPPVDDPNEFLEREGWQAGFYGLDDAFERADALELSRHIALASPDPELEGQP